MPIPVTCPSCQASGHVPDEALGHQLTCPVCGHAFLLTDSHSPISSPDLFGVWVDPSLATVPPPPADAAPAGVVPTQVAPVPETPVTYAPEVPALEGVPAVEPTLPAGPQVPTPPEWVDVEKRRFEVYLSDGLARLERTRRENAEAESRHEAGCLARAVELSRQSALLTVREQELDRQHEELQRVEDALAAREGELTARAAQLDEREAAVVALEGHRAKLEAEAASLAKLMAELRPAVEHLELRKVEAEAVRAELVARQSALDRRLISVGRSELAIQKRMAELDEMEETLRVELEEREADLERQRTTLVEEVRAIRERGSVAHMTPMPRAALPPALPAALTPRAPE